MYTVGSDPVVYDLDGTLVRLAVDWEDVSREAASVLEERGIDPPGNLWEMLVLADESGHRDAVEAVIAGHEREGARDSERLPAADHLARRLPDDGGGDGDVVEDGNGDVVEDGDGNGDVLEDGGGGGDGNGNGNDHVTGDGDGNRPVEDDGDGNRTGDGAVGVCSLNCVDACHLALERHELAGRVDAVVGRDSVPAQKPDPEPLLVTVRELGVSPDRVLFVGDSGRDALTARRAGVEFVHVDDWLERAYP